MCGSDVDVLSSIRESKQSVIIFGAGVMGRYVAQLCREANIKPIAFCDSDSDKFDSEVDDLPVWSLVTVRDRAVDNPVFIITPRDIKTIATALEETGYKKYYGLCHIQPLLTFWRSFSHKERLHLNIIWMKQHWDEHYFYFYGEQLTIKYLDFVLTEKCSLKCCECSNLMQYYEQPKAYPLPFLKKELDRLSQLYYSVKELRLIGGEPLIYPHIGEIIKYVSNFDAFGRIVIYTNGTVLPTPDLFDIMENSGKVRFSISDYGELSRHLALLTAELQKRNIKYIVNDFPWTKCSSLKKHGRTEQELVALLADCCVKNVVTILDGKIYPCPFIANGSNLKALPPSQDCVVDVMRTDDLSTVKNKLKDMHESKFYSLCDYCNGRPIYPKDEELIPPHEQIMHPLPYYKYD